MKQSLFGLYKAPLLSKRHRCPKHGVVCPAFVFRDGLRVINDTTTPALTCLSSLKKEESFLSLILPNYPNSSPGKTFIACRK